MKRILLFLAFFLCLEGYSDDRLVVSTFNIGMRNKHAPHRSLRFEKILEGLAELDSDILCLREVFGKERQKILSALKKKYPFVHYSKFSESLIYPPACSIADIFSWAGAFSCRLKNCLRKRNEILGQCLIKHCSKSIDRLREKNTECAMAQMAQQENNMVTAFFNLLNPWKKIRRFTHPAGDGLILFSTLPLANKGVMDFSLLSSQERKGVVYGEVEKNGTRVSIFCADLTEDYEGVYPYFGPLKSWQEENSVQVRKMMKNLFQVDKTIILGGLGCSREMSFQDVHKSFEENCRPLLKKGFVEPLYDESVECTYCPYNNLVPRKLRGGLVLDHIFGRGLRPEGFSLTFKTPFQTVQGESFLSDHFGIKGVFRIEAQEEE